MVAIEMDEFVQRLETVALVDRIGRVEAISLNALRVSGLSDRLRLGERVAIRCGQPEAGGEVTAILRDHVLVLPDDGMERIRIGAMVRPAGPDVIHPDDSWIGRVIDASGQPLDGRPLLPGRHARPLLDVPPAPAGRRALGARIETGLCCFDTFLPVVRGQRIGLFAGSGVGKSSLLASFARDMAADVVVMALIGERGRELRHFIDQVLQAEGMARSVVVAATSDRSAGMRRRCIWTAMTIAEHFRDQGRHVLLLADSVTRFADAHREIAAAAGEPMAMRGYPASLSSQIMALAERAGPGATGQGDITAIMTVLVAGSDMDEPVADILRGTLDGHVVLDRAIAERGRFPAINLLRSISRSLPAAASEAENALLLEARRVIATWEQAEMMIQAGLYVAGSDPRIDEAIRLWPALDGFLAGRQDKGPRSSFATLAHLLGRAAPTTTHDTGTT